MKIVYYYVLYLRGLKDPNKIEIHCEPFNTKKEAEDYQAKADKHFGERYYSSTIKRVDLSKFEKGIWLK